MKPLKHTFAIALLSLFGLSACSSMPDTFENETSLNQTSAQQSLEQTEDTGGFFDTLFNIEPWVKPYERSNLADPIMAIGRNPIALSYAKHVHESREGARGADGSAGGGCGCN